MPNRLAIALAAVLVAAAAVNACGQKGPLYLPSQQDARQDASR